jgi:Cu/Ag efflux pump CusA
MKIGMTSETLSQMDMSELAKWTIRPRLMALPGVANVAIWGQRDRQYQIVVEPERLRLHNIPLNSVIKSAQDATTLGAGGFLDTPNQRLADFS